MKTALFFVTFVLAFAATTSHSSGVDNYDFTCLRGHEAVASTAMTEALQQAVVATLRQKGIEIDASQVALKVSTSFFSAGIQADGHDPHPLTYGTFVIDNGDFKTALGSTLRVAFAGNDDAVINWPYEPAYKPILKSDGLDHEGNPINGHCVLAFSLRPNMWGLGRYAVIRNVSSGAIEGKFNLPLRISLY